MDNLIISPSMAIICAADAWVIDQLHRPGIGIDSYLTFGN